MTQIVGQRAREDSGGRILLLSWTVPPETTGSAVIVGNLAKQFTRSEMVIAGERPCDRPPVVWKDEWPEIVYTNNAWPALRRGARWWRRCQLPFVFLRCWRIVRRCRCTRLLLIFPSEDILLVGYLLTRITGMKLYPYFHNTYVEQRTPGGVAHRFAAWLQAKVFYHARHVFVMSQGMVDLYRERYPHVTRCSALVHSFNDDIPEAPAFSPPGARDPVRVTLSGNINASCVDAAVRSCAALAQLNGRLTVLSGTPRAYLQQLGILREGVQYETVSRDDIVRRLGEADIVLLAHGFTGPLSQEEYRTIFPTRTIEYLICGRPILLHAPADCYLTRFMEQYRCALIVNEPRVESVRAGIRRLSEDADLRITLVRQALKAAALFRAPVVAGMLRSILSQT